MTRTIDQKKDTEIEDPIVQLKKILLADNLNSISQLEANLEHFKLQWNDRNWLIKTLDPIIISLLSKKINDSGDEIADVLAPVIGISIQKRIEVAREDIVDALYPVIGKSIRKSIAEAIKVLAQKVNDRIDRALSFDLILNKIKSKISGVNGASFLIQDAISYHIQEIFYIHKNTGVLLTHVHDRSVSPHNDEDIISGMLTAIRDFAKSAFIDKQAQDLSEIQYEDFQILIENGRNAYLALVVTGIFPIQLREQISNLEQSLHKQYFKLLREFEGDISPFKQVQSVLSDFLDQYNVDKSGKIESKKRKSSTSGLKYILAVILITTLVYIGFFYIPMKIDEYRLTQQLEELRKTNSLLASENIEIKVNEGNVILDGVTSNWNNRNEIEMLISLQPNVEKVENYITVNNSDFDSQNLYRAIKSYDLGQFFDLENEIKFIIDDNHLFIEGITESAESKILISSIVGQNTNFPVIINNLSINDSTIAIKRKIEATIIHFESGQSFVSSEKLPFISNIAKYLRSINYNKLYIIGYADTIGNIETNLKISRQRAESVKELLVKMGIAPDKLITIGKGTINSDEIAWQTEILIHSRIVKFSFN